MIGFLIKKSFWDFWDRMGVMIMINAGFTALTVGSSFLIFLTLTILPLTLAVTWFSLVLVSVYMGMVSGMVEDLIHNRSFFWKTFGKSLKKNFLKSFIYGSLVFLAYMIFTVVFRFYGQIEESFVSLIAFFMMCWFVLFLMMAQVWFYPLMQRMDDPLLKHLKKTLLLALDNGWQSFFILIWSLFLLALSAATVLLIPGISSLLILWHNALKLVMHKYEYLEKFPEQRKKIPWKVILQAEREHLGKRGLSDFIRPGKL